MTYQVRYPDNSVQLFDEEAATQVLTETPAANIARFETNQWVSAASFLAFGEAAFDSKNLLIPRERASLTSILLSTETFPPYNIASRLGIIAAEQVTGVNLIDEFKAGIIDLTGGTSKALQKRLAEARQAATRDLRQQAHEKGADGVIAIQYTYSTIEGKDTLMVLVAAVGTAVTFS